MRIEIGRSWWRTRRAMRLSAQALAAHRQRKWAALQPALARTPALAPFAGKPLADFPVTGIADMRADYGQWNSLGLTDACLRAMADAAERAEDTGHVTAGWSTGTGGGARGLFVADAHERADYLGQTLARLLPPREMLRRQRIALHLRAGNALYSDVERGRIAFRHFPLQRTPEETRSLLQQFNPTILIAPPHRLLSFAREGAQYPALRHLFTGSEPISASESNWIADILGLRPRAIWQATEGFLGAECAEGRLHLNDHAMAIELEAIPGTAAFRPIITDLRRRSQPIVRVRGDDVLEQAQTGPCPCGFAGRVIHPVQGRITDIWRFADLAVLPREVVEAVEAAFAGQWAWQATADARQVSLRVQSTCPEALVTRARESLASKVPVPVNIDADMPPWACPAWTGLKRHKVLWHG